MIALPFLLYAILFLGLWLALYNLAPLSLLWVSQSSNAIVRRLIGFRAGQRLFSPFHRRLIVPVRDRITPYRAFLPVALIAATGAILSILAGLLFLELAEAVQDGSSVMERVDESVHGWAEHLRTEVGTSFFTFFTVVGTPVGLGILVVIVSGVLIAKGRYRWSAFLAITTVLGGLLNLALKSIFERQRPDLSTALRHASGFSFPSGHAMGATIVFGALAYLAVRHYRTWKARSGALAAAAATIAAICVSRIYLGVHWISDIIAGVSSGAVWVLATTLAYEVFRRVRAIRLAESQRSLEGVEADDA
ncbi:MAG TPA: phosphatase PAP2 family protein [Thermoanaerobaculia bacterium]|nr:phosphatase PAP2 family protein [Thermoanaerobaculia bacterium]